jgi:hypothetical protein
MCGWTVQGNTKDFVETAAAAHSDETGARPEIIVKEIPNAFPGVARLESLEFSAAELLPSDDNLTAPLLRLMLASDDVRLTRLLYRQSTRVDDPTVAASAGR